MANTAIIDEMERIIDQITNELDRPDQTNATRSNAGPLVPTPAVAQAVGAAYDKISATMANVAAQTGSAAQIDAAAQLNNSGVTSNMAAQPGVAGPMNTAKDDDGDEDESGTESDEESEDGDSDCEDSASNEWEASDMLHYHCEPSYLGDGPHEKLTDDAFFERVAYDDCTPSELKQFVIDRLLKDPYPKGVTLKYYYLRILDQADREWQFRIMDLPPEIRLEIIRNLLLFSRRHSLASVDTKAFPVILQTCKQILEEARGILYDENTISMSFKAQTGEGSGSGFRAIVHDRVSEQCCKNHTSWLRLPRGINDYPDFLRRIARLDVNLELVTSDTDVTPGDSVWPLNNFLYSLASFLMDGHRLQNLHLKVDISSALDDVSYGKIFYPLRRLRNVDTVTIEGHIPSSIKTKLVEDLKSIEPSFNTVRHWNLILSEMMIQLDVHEMTHKGLGGCPCGCTTPECLQEFCFRLQRLSELGAESGFSSRMEENFLANLAAEKSFLRRINVKDLKDTLKRLAESRDEMARYDLVTDDGRLEEADKILGGDIRDPGELEYDLQEDWGDDSDAMDIDEKAKVDKLDDLLARGRFLSLEL